MLSLAILLQSLEPVLRWYPQIYEDMGLVQLVELPTGHIPKI